MNYYAGFGIIFLFIGGYYLDQNLHSGYTWSLTGLILGIVYLGYEIWKSLRKK